MRAKVIIILTAATFAFAVPAAELTIIYTGPTDGILQDCGCNELAIGGVAARASIIKQLKSKYPDAIVVDVGDMLPPREGPQTELKAKYALKIYSLLDYDAVNLGDGDFSYGPAYVAEFRDRYGINTLSAVVNEPDKYGVKPYTLLERGDLTIGLIGTFHADLYDGPSELATEDIVDAKDAAKKSLKELSKETDVQILIAHAGTPNQCRVFAEKLKGLADVVVAGGGYGLAHGGLDANGTHVTFSPPRGRYVGLLIIGLDEESEVISVTDELIPITLGAPRDDAVLEYMEEYYVNLRKLVNEESLLAAPEAPTAEGFDYAGSSGCAACHAGPYEQWSNTGHARAYETLVEVGRWFDPECVACHVTGYGYVGGFASAEETPDRAGVGCESCHGPGAGHPGGSTAFSPVAEERCLKCHTEQNSPDFVYEEYLKPTVHYTE
jgi:2',3'-cyclic-nucleotide 2'-phosphodiesterase (5'-nucleotidase family)